MPRKQFSSALYVDRPDITTSIERLIEDCTADQAAGVLLTGAGGVGKTWIFNHLEATINDRISEFDKTIRLYQRDEGGFIFGTLSLDRTERDSWNWLIQLRESIRINRGFQPEWGEGDFPRFDTLSVLYAEHIGMPGFEHPSGSPMRSVGSHWAGSIDTIQSISTGIKVIPFLQTLRARWQKHVIHRDQQKFPSEFEGREVWTRDDYLERLPIFLAHDLNALCSTFPKNKLVLLIDSHDRLLSARSEEESRQLESALKRFVSHLTSGVICIFSQYFIRWFVDGSSCGEEAPAITTTESEDALDAFFSTFQADDALQNETVTGVSTSRNIRHIRVGEFSEDTARIFLKSRGFTAPEDAEFCDVIVRTTRLPFEIEEKAEELRDFDRNHEGWQRQLSARLSQPFDIFFNELMNAKPPFEADLLRVLWNIDVFTVEIVEEYCKLIGIPAPRHCAERTLEHGMIEAVPDGSLQWFRVIPHYVRHLQMNWLSKREHKLTPKFAVQRNALAILRDFVWGDGRQAANLDGLAIAFGTDELTAFGNALAKLAESVQLVRQRDLQSRQMHELDGSRFLAARLDLLLRCVKSSKRNEKPSTLIGGWSTSLAKDILYDAVDDLASVASDLSGRETLNKLNDLDNILLPLALTEDNRGSRPFLGAGIRVVEAYIGVIRRWSAFSNAELARSKLTAWISMLGERGDETGFFFKRNDSWSANYWRLRLICFYYMYYPHLQPGTRRRHAHHFGASRSHFLMAIEEWRQLLSSDISNPVILERHHRVASLRFRLYEARNKYVNQRTAAEEALSSATSEARQLATEYPDDPEVMSLLASIYLEREGRRLTSKELFEMCRDLRSAFERGGRRLEILHVLEKASVNYARALLRERSEKGNQQSDDSHRHAMNVLRDIHELLRREIDKRISPTLELSKLFLKNLRKSSQEGFQPDDTDSVARSLSHAFAQLETLPASILEGFAYEAVLLAARNESLGTTILEAVSTVASPAIARLSEVVEGTQPTVANLEIAAAWLNFVALLTSALRSMPAERKIAENQAALAALEQLFARDVIVASRYKSTRHQLFSRTITLLLGQIEDGSEDWNGVITLFRHGTTFLGRYPASILKRLILLALSKWSSEQFSLSLLTELEQEAFNRLPLDLRWFGALAVKRNQIDTKLSQDERDRRDLAVAELATLPEPGSSSDANEDQEVAARIAAASALCFCKMADQHTQVDKVRRILAEALVSSDPILRTDDHIRQRLRTAYARAVWDALHSIVDTNRGLPFSNYGSPPVDALTKFAAGENDRIFEDLLAVLFELPEPRDLAPKDLLIMRANAITGLVADNGPLAEAGPLFVGSFGTHQLALPSNLLSFRDHQLLVPAIEIADEETEAVRESDADQREVVAARFHSRSEAISGPQYALQEPVLRLVAVIDTQAPCSLVTERGREFLLQALGLVFPGVLDYLNPRTRFVLGGSNSWAVAVVSDQTKSALLYRDGWFTRALERFLGLRRLTIACCSQSSGAQAVEDELREFVNSGFANLRLIEFDGSTALYTAPANDLTNDRRLKTFRSAFAKCFPGLRLKIVDRTNWWKPSSGEIGIVPDRPFDRIQADLVDNAALLQEEQLFAIEDIQRRTDTNSLRIRLVDDGDRVAYLRSPLTEASGITFVVGQRLLCSLKHGRRGDFEVTSVRIYEPGDDELDDLIVVQIDRGNFKAKLAVSDDSYGDVFTGNLWLARYAGYRNLSTGTVIRAEVRRADDRDRIVYIRPTSRHDPLLQRFDLQVDHYVQARGGGYVLTRRGAPDDSVYLPGSLVAKAGYRSLYQGDTVTADVFNLSGRRVVSRLISCNRKMVRNVRGYLNGRRSRPNGGDVWSFEVIDDSRRSLLGIKRPLLISEAEHDLEESVNVLPRGAFVVADLQDDSRGGWRMAANVALDLVDDGAWQLGRVRIVWQAGGKSLAFLKLLNGEEAFVPPHFLPDLGEGAFNGAWFEARICRCYLDNREKLSACDLRRPRNPCETRGRVTSMKGTTAEVFVKTEEGLILPVGFSTFQRAGLATVGIERLPVRCFVREVAGTLSIIDLRFDQSRGWHDQLCFLLPYSPDDESRLLCRVDGNGRLTVREEPFFSEVAYAAPGTMFAVAAFRDRRGDWRAVTLKRETARIPWRYGFVIQKSLKVITIHIFGGDSISLDRYLVERRDGRDPEIGAIVRFTDQPEPLGMFEYQDTAAPWPFEGLVSWYDKMKDFGKIALVDDEAIDIRFSVSKLASSIPEWKKALPVTISLSQVVKKISNRTGEFVLRGNIENVFPINIRELPWRRMVIREVFSGSSALFDVEGADGTAGLAYGPPHIAMLHEDDAPLAKGIPFIGQTVRGLKGTATVVNIAWLPPDGDSPAIYNTAVCERADYRGRVAKFRLLFSGEVVVASPKLFSTLEADLPPIAKDDILFLELGSLDRQVVADAVLERLGRVLDAPFVDDSIVEAGDASIKISSAVDLAVSL
uniref:Uncharacterized protein n=1 Tax=Rhodopseudomonas palustris (strain BisA53) TaxID=316055 RepID=Q07SW1_RHOP5